MATNRISWNRALQNLLLPPVCIACESAMHQDSVAIDLGPHICAACRNRIGNENLESICTGCGARLKGQPGDLSDCYYCRDLKMPFRSVTCLANYDGYMRELIVRMKSRNGHALTIQMGRWLALALKEKLESGSIPDLSQVVPIPSHWMRRIHRGFQVSGLLAESICRIPELSGMHARLLVQNRKTRKQGTLTMNQRFRNVQGSFELSGKPDLQEASILLVDDVMTSGATALQAAQVLLDAGAREIHLAIIARGIGNQS